jgi:hypothetical protein
VAPRRGEIWTTSGQVPRTILIVSGNLFNDLPDWPYVLAMDTADATDITIPPPVTVPIGQGRIALIDSIRQTAKPLLTHKITQIDIQTISDVHNALFRLLATN